MVEILKAIVETVRGLVRPFVAIAIVASVCWKFVTNEAVEITAAEVIPIATTVIAFYFAERLADKIKNGNGNGNGQ